MRSKLFLAVIAVLIIAGGGYYYLHSSKQAGASAQQAQRQMPPTAVDVVTVKVQDLEVTNELSGRTSSFKVAEIRPQVSGIIKNRLFTEGSLVKKGEQLYQIDPAPYEASLAAARAALMQAEASVLATKPKAERYAELVKIGGISQQEYDDAAAALKQAEASVAAATANVQTAKINLDYTKVYAPISGQIGKSSVTEGALVTANQGTALATIQTLDKIYVDVKQSASEVRKLRKSFAATGTKVKLYVEGETEPYAFEGEFQFTDVSVDETTGMVDLRILFPNPEMALLPGLFVKARIEQEKLHNVILVPQRAVMRNLDGSTTSWVAAEGNKVEVRKVELMKAYGNKWIVTAGLAEGDKVLINGFQKTRPGAVVAPAEITDKQ